MGIAIAGQIPSGLAIAGQKPSGIAIAGQNVFTSGPPQWELLTSVQGNSTSNITTAAIDTTGANLIILACSGNVIGTVYDNQNNTWTRAQLGGYGTPYTAIYYCINPLVSTSHIFYITGSFTFMCALVYQCEFIPLLDQGTATAFLANTANLSIGAITPSKNNSLIVANIGMGGTSGNINSIDSGFELIPNSPNPQCKAATLIQRIAATINPTWNVVPTAYAPASAMQSFIPSPWQLLDSTQILYLAVALPTPAIDTTGATLIVLIGAQLYSQTVSDSAGNVWTLGVDSGATPQYNNYSRIYYCINPVTSPTHTFNMTGTYSSLLVLAFKGPSSIVADQKSTISSAEIATALTLNPIAFSAVSLVISGVVNINNITSLDSGFSIAATTISSSTSRVGAAAYLISGANPSLAPTWTFLASAFAGTSAATMLSFIPSP